MSQQHLSSAVASAAAEFGVPGASVGILLDGREIHASHGVTSVEGPLPVDEHTLFHLGSATKPYTATALLRLATEGKVDLHAPVRRYVPELQLADERAAAEVTVFQLLNHTAGLGWNLIDAGPGEADPAAFVTVLDRLELIAPPGTRASYSQAGYNVLGRVMEKVTGLPFEKAVASLVLEPLGLTRTFFDLDDVIVRRFALGHVRDGDGELRIARPWKSWPAAARANNPGGGAASCVSDLLRWARFHLGGGDGVLPAEVLHGMREQTVALRGSSLGDGFGIGWFLREVDGVRTIGHGGSGNGQFSELLIVPERDFAVVSLANEGTRGHGFNQAVVRWALEHCLGLVERDPEPVPYDASRAREIVGRYEIDALNLDIATDGSQLTLGVAIKPEIRAASDAEMPPDHEPATMGLLPGDGDEYILTAGGLKGQRGYFTRDETGTITGADLAGRLFTRTAPGQQPGAS
ncbi:serine hydrolase domain-containing protein [Streptomyces sp. NPDC001351]|uniref:serine hydrolase domain-containing protein n=1 Tax=Streptomyces sp. NPDC001351 TaxID=3364564 RepID=UPI003673ECAD